MKRKKLLLCFAITLLLGVLSAGCADKQCVHKITWNTVDRATGKTGTMDSGTLCGKGTWNKCSENYCKEHCAATPKCLK